jgi:hypothetical protein
MQDVIFSGSGNRKGASRASVELVFDNSSARAPFRRCALFGHGEPIGSADWPAWVPAALQAP